MEYGGGQSHSLYPKRVPSQWKCTLEGTQHSLMYIWLTLEAYRKRCHKLHYFVIIFIVPILFSVQVTLTGNWTFASSLPFPLHLSLASTPDQDSASDRDTPYELQETLLLPPKSSLPSIVVPESQLSGVRIRSAQSSSWSEVYPIHSTTDDWSKPQLLTEVSDYNRLLT